MNAQNWTKLGLFISSSVIYLAIFFSLGLLISCLTHRSSTSLVISLFVWTILVFLIPNLGNILARQVVRIPTAQQLELERKRITNRMYFEMKRILKNQVDSEERQKELALRTIKEGDQLDEDYRNRINKLVKVSRGITGLSPAPAFTLLATDIMGTGVSEERRLKKEAQDYKDMVVQMFFIDGTLTDDSEPPKFHYQRSSVKEILAGGGLSNCVILILLNVLFFSGAYVAFLKYDVR
jgi:ABC-type transport system involved in multi-copper enzyme maturation permease subunit